METNVRHNGANQSGWGMQAERLPPLSQRPVTRESFLKRWGVKIGLVAVGLTTAVGILAATGNLPLPR